MEMEVESEGEDEDEESDEDDETETPKAPPQEEGATQVGLHYVSKLDILGILVSHGKLTSLLKSTHHASIHPKMKAPHNCI